MNYTYTFYKDQHKIVNNDNQNLNIRNQQIITPMVTPTKISPSQTRVENQTQTQTQSLLESTNSPLQSFTSMDATRQFTPEEMKELQRRVEAGNKHLEETQKIAIVDDSEADSEINLNETQTFKLNIEE